MPAGGLGHDDFYGAILIGRVAYHDFEGITVHAGEQPATRAESRREACADSAQSRTARRRT